MDQEARIRSIDLKLKTGVENPYRAPFTFFQYGSVAAGAVDAVFFNLEPISKEGSIQSFIFDFDIFTPPAGSYTVKILWNNTPIPSTQNFSLVDVSLLLGKLIPQSKYWKADDSTVFQVLISNTNAGFIFPTFELRGNYYDGTARMDIN